MSSELIDDDGTDSLNIGLFFSGFYEPLQPVDDFFIPCIFAIDDTEFFSVMSHDPEGNSRIVLSENKSYEAILLLSPDYAFRSISRESIEEAGISGDNGYKRIIISSNKNKNLYENLLYRIGMSTSIVIV
jgi:hypothetical protein